MRNYLSIISSSILVEATCGLLLNAKRMIMAPYRVNVVAVIHDNYAKFLPITRAAAASSDNLV